MIPLDFVQSPTENVQNIAELFRRLMDQGLEPAQELLVVINGSQGLRRTVDKLLGD
ncbi:MAG: hypothetical protein GF372_08765 [Candidatus Marinimicrobia bacterium]|nr:hypothetical protein [Candidatus Neomarinimicrobiota bacterium]